MFWWVVIAYTMMSVVETDDKKPPDINWTEPLDTNGTGQSDKNASARCKYYKIA